MQHSYSTMRPHSPTARLYAEPGSLVYRRIVYCYYGTLHGFDLLPHQSLGTAVNGGESGTIISKPRAEPTSIYTPGLGESLLSST